MTRIMVVDTETTSVNKPFCYNVGYVIADLEDNGNFQILEKKEFIVKQVWRNTMLFSTAYYADKKPIYTNKLRHKAEYNNICILRYDEIMEEAQKSIDNYNVKIAYAYNSQFDEKVFAFNCEWFRTENPFAEIPFFDIRAYFINAVKDSNDYKAFCEHFKLFTDSENYSTTAETAYKFITNDDTFVEAHTALNDSEIEMEILAKCANWGEKVFEYLPTAKCIERPIEKVFTIQYKGKDYHYKGLTAKWYKSRNKLIIK